jgi:cytochrome P450
MLRTLLGRYAPTTVKNLARRTWQRVRPRPASPPARHLFVFGGRAHFWAGMGRELYEREPVFQATIRAGAAFVASQGGPTLLEQFEQEVAADYLTEDRILYSLTLVQLALADLYRAQGIAPEAFMGISLGEIAAVYAAGGISLPDALRVVQSIALVQKLAPDYGILRVGATYAQASELAGCSPVPLFVSAVLEAEQCYLVCATSHLAAAAAYVKQQGAECQVVRNEPLGAYHIIQLAQHREALRQPLLRLQPQPLARPCYLTGMGRLVPSGTVLGPDYWLQMMQYPMLLHPTLQAARHDGYRLFTAIGPYPLPFLTTAARHAALGEGQLLASLAPSTDAHATFTATQQALAGRGLVQPQALPAPELPFAAFLAQLTLRSPDFIVNPHPTFELLRAQGGLHFLPAEQGWLVLDTELINAVLKQPTVFSSTVNADFDDQLIGADPPVHTSNRAATQAYFTPKQLATLGDYTAAAVAELGAGLAGRPSFDFITEFAIPLAQAVVCQLLGLSPAEQAALQSRLPGHAYSLEYLDPLTQYFTDYFTQRQPTGAPALLDQLLARVRHGDLALPAAVNLAKTMWLAGIPTSSMLQSSAAYYLLHYPALANELRARPELVDNFVEEMLRLEPPVNFIWRITNQEVELGGRALPAGALVVLSIGAANRDPARLPHPDEVDIYRRPVRHLAFGGGIHACMGAHLARLEARSMVRWLLAQTHLRFLRPGMLPAYYPNLYFRAHAHLPLTLQPSPAAPC